MPSKLKVCGQVLLVIAGFFLYVFGLLYLMFLFMDALVIRIQTGSTLQLANFWALTVFIPTIVVGCGFLFAYKEMRAWLRSLPWLERTIGLYIALAAYGGVYCGVVLAGYLPPVEPNFPLRSVPMIAFRVILTYTMCGAVYVACTIGIPTVLYVWYRGFNVLRLCDPEDEERPKSKKAEKPQPEDDDAYERMA